MRAIAFRAENVEEILGSYFEDYEIREVDAHHTLRLIEEARLGFAEDALALGRAGRGRNDAGRGVIDRLEA